MKFIRSKGYYDPRQGNVELSWTVFTSDVYRNWYYVLSGFITISVTLSDADFYKITYGHRRRQRPSCEYQVILQQHHHPANSIRPTPKDSFSFSHIYFLFLPFLKDRDAYFQDYVILLCSVIILAMPGGRFQQK